MKRRAETAKPKSLPYRVVEAPINVTKNESVSTEEKIKNLNHKMNVVILNQKKILHVLRQLTAHPIDMLGPQDIKTDDSDLWTPQRFPLTELEQMEAVEEDMNDPVKASVYVETMKDLLKPGGIFRAGGLQKNFHLILRVDFMVMFNLDGIHHKIPLKKFANFSRALYKVLKRDEAYVMDDYIAEIRTTFRVYKNRNNKRASVVRRKMKEAEAHIEPELDFEEIICSETSEFIDEFD
ncbi:hypothetical protein KR059_001529 [Drosophila kikkawai]|nr:hypothetical protein KR059_001529 [Drosophila kikkawai]